MRGFTLLELLIAMVLLAVVVSLTYGAYNTTFKVMDGASARAKYGERARVTFDRIRDDLSSFYRGSDPVFTGITKNYGDYRGDQLTFSSTAHLSFSKGSLVVGQTTIRYRIVQDDGLLQLFRVDQPYYPDDSIDIDDLTGMLLCDDLKEFSLKYIDSDDNSEDSWKIEDDGSDSDSTLPVMVEVHLVFQNEEKDDELISYSTRIALPQETEP